ncbi:MAG TPA: hypothetical protein VFD26_06180 [Methyloceanibacter sp.]|nr:hypothetical protein [Methyloceanibacter sp.]
MVPTFGIEESPARAPVYTEQAGPRATPIAYSVVFFAVVLVLLAGPAFFGQYFNTAEEQVSLFGAAYGLRLFYPGSNRIVMVVPWLTSWLGTPEQIAAAHFAIITGLPSVALAVVAHALPQRAYFPFCVTVLVAIAVLFGGGMYQFHVSMVQPYVVPFSLGLICSTVLLRYEPKGIWFPLLALALFVPIVTAAGINPASSLLFLIFFGLCFVAAIIGSPVEAAGRVWFVKHGLAVMRARRGFVAGALLNLAATAVIFWSYGWYKRHFPQYVKSNYSVESYLSSGLSFAELTKQFNYLLDFHQGAGLLGVTATRLMVGGLLVCGIAGLVLWAARRWARPVLARLYLVSFLLWASAILVIAVVSQNAHVQLVPNAIRGRYATLPLYALFVAACLIIATVVADIMRASTPWRRVGLAWYAAASAVAVGSLVAHIVSWGPPTLSIVKPRPEYVRLAADIRAAKTVVLLGNYWWVWDIQYEINRNAAKSPAATPISIRTESFGLEVFKPMLDSLADAKSVRFVCIELKNPPPGLEQPCDPQIESYRFQLGFPLGKITEVSRAESGDFKLTYYDLALEGADDPDDCTASQITLRAKALPAPGPGEDAFDLDEESFVYLQRPGPRTQWVLNLKGQSGEEVITVPRDSSLERYAVGHRIGIIARGCRVMVTISHRDHFYPSTLQLTVQ